MLFIHNRSISTCVYRRYLTCSKTLPPFDLHLSLHSFSVDKSIIMLSYSGIFEIFIYPHKPHLNQETVVQSEKTKGYTVSVMQLLTKSYQGPCLLTGLSLCNWGKFEDGSRGMQGPPVNTKTKTNIQAFTFFGEISFAFAFEF